MKTMDINVFFDEGFEDCLDAKWLKGLIISVLNAEKAGNKPEMGLVITGQQHIQELNRDYRGIDKPTDVLSFTMQEGEEAEFTLPPDGKNHLGEVIISYPQAELQAAEHRHTVKREIATLTIHGILHLLGYDHIEDEEAEQMEARERQILQNIEGKIE